MVVVSTLESNVTHGQPTENCTSSVRPRSGRIIIWKDTGTAGATRPCLAMPSARPPISIGCPRSLAARRDDKDGCKSQPRPSDVQRSPHAHAEHMPRHRQGLAGPGGCWPGSPGPVSPRARHAREGEAGGGGTRCVSRSGSRASRDMTAPGAGPAGFGGA